MLPSEAHTVANVISLRATDGDTSYHWHESFSFTIKFFQVPHRQQVQSGGRPRGRHLSGQGDSAQDRNAILAGRKCQVMQNHMYFPEEV